jgi:hypothetical protein
MRVCSPRRFLRRRGITKKLLGAAAIMLTGTPALAQSASATKTSSKGATTNGKVSSASSTPQKARCRNDKGAVRQMRSGDKREHDGEGY